MQQTINLAPCSNKIDWFYKLHSKFKISLASVSTYNKSGDGRIQGFIADHDKSIQDKLNFHHQDNHKYSPISEKSV